MAEVIDLTLQVGGPWNVMQSSHWQPIRNSRSRHKFLVEMCCSNGHKFPIKRTTHTIDKDGLISPSIVCSQFGCNFHSFVRLRCWSPAAHDINENTPS